VKIRVLPLVKWFALCMTLLSPTSYAETQILDSVVAIVEDNVIMSSELRERLAMLTQSLQAAGRELPPQDVLVRETLDRLILESIQIQMGQRAGVRISDAQLNSALNRIASQNGLTLDQFRLDLQSEGKSYQSMREDVRREIVLQRVQGGNVSQRIQISEQEIDNFLESDEGRELTAEQYHLVHALLPVAEGTSPADEQRIKAHVDQLYARIAEGDSFEEVIGDSGGEYVFTGGDLGWRKSSELPSVFADVAPTLEVNQTAAPIRSPSGYHIIYLAEKRGGSTVIQQTEVRHILLKPSAIRTPEDCQELALNLRQQIIDGADFTELAREYSEDIGSAQEGGELGWTSPGQMVPEFESMMDSTAIGDISQPVQSQFGWHILEVQDRRQEDVSDSIVRNQAGETLHQRKYQEELDAWLRKIRDEAFVDIK
jgi:peptidyl-prolyl cis-trans isomerase SurA